MKVLIVDDSLMGRKLVEEVVENEFNKIYTATCGKAALVMTLQHKPEFIILDVMMPDIDGFQICRKIRKNPNIYGYPYIMMLTGKDSDDDVITGFENGADDYLKKPFNSRELLLRVKSGLRKNNKVIKSLYYGKLTIFEESKTVRLDEEEVKLSKTLFKLLVYFIKNKGISLSREMIYKNVWEEEFVKGNRTVDVYVRRLKDKIACLEDGIESQCGFGYRLK